MSRNYGISIHVFLVCCQYLIPAFAHLTGGQIAAVASCIAAVQGALGISAYSLQPDGTKLPAAARPPGD